MLLVFYLAIITSPLSAILYYHLENQYPRLPHFSQKQAVVILSGGTLTSERDGDYFKYHDEVPRVLEGLRFFNRSRSNVLVMSEGNTSGFSKSRLSEGESFLKFAQDLGVNTDKMFLISNIKNTYEEAKNFSVQYQEVRDFYLVTSAYHMQRAVAVFHKLGLHPTPVPVGHKTSRGDFYSWKIDNIYLAEAVLTEYAGLIAYKILNRI